MQSGGLCCTTLAILRKRTTPRRNFIPNICTPNIICKRPFQSLAIPSDSIENPLNSAELESSSATESTLAEEQQTLSRSKLKNIRVPPPRLIAEWLEENDEGHIVVKRHRSDQGKVPISDFLSLQNILLKYLGHKAQHRATYSHEALYNRSLPTFRRLGYTLDDLEQWSAILGVSTSDAPKLSRRDAATRYLRSEEEIPFFILLIILRFNQLLKWEVRALILHTWYRFLGYSQKEIGSMMSMDPTDSTNVKKAPFFPADWESHPWEVPLSKTPGFSRLEENAFMVLISRLLTQARRTLPQALPSITCMFGSYLWFTRGTLEPRSDGSINVVSRKTHARLSVLFNQAIKKLSLPTVATPAINMKYAWHAQRLLIEQAGRYSPPLLLDQDSYRAIIRVLGTLKKSTTESKYADNMAPTWPPWREEQDGVDAERPIEDDLSRSVLASRRMIEAGFHLDYLDWELLITGGRDSDGTPTVAHRHVSKRRSGKHYGEHRLWVGRIRATRSAREAWMAFLAFDQEKGPIPLAIYHVVFEKLVYERLRLLRYQISEALPGESKEVIQHPFQNFTRDELARTEPIEEQLLYNHMVDSNLRPSGRFLDFLVRTAPNVATGIQYLQDADLHKAALAMMLDFTSYKTKSPRDLEKVMPYSTSDAFIRLLCRFTYGPSYTDRTQLSLKNHGRPEPPNLAGISKFKTPLHYAVQLVRFYKPLFEPTWYSLFRALARPRVVIAATFSGHPQDDVLSWHVLKQVLAEFHSCRLELDLTGFHSVCFCFEKAVRASWIPVDDYTPLPDMLQPVSANWKDEDLDMIKAEWRRMTESVFMPFDTPRLLHSFYHAGIHAYVRVLGIARDWEEMVAVLQWMMAHREELDEAARDYANGKRMRRRVLVALRYFIDGALAELEQDQHTEEPPPGDRAGNPAEMEQEDTMGDKQAQQDDEDVDSAAGTTEPEAKTSPNKQDFTEDASPRGEKETSTNTERESGERLHMSELRLRMLMLLEQDDFKHWGGWPSDEEVRYYARITKAEGG